MSPMWAHDVVVDGDVVQRDVASIRDDVGVGHRRPHGHDLFADRLHDLDSRVRDIGGAHEAVSVALDLGVLTESPSRSPSCSPGLPSAPGE